MATAVSNSVSLPAVNGNNGTLTDEVINGLVQGGSWQFAGGARTLTYSFNVNWDFDAVGNLIPGVGGSWTASLIAATNRALTEWSNVANITFQNITSGNYYFQSSADIAFTLTGDELQSDPEIPAVGFGIFPDPAIGGLLRSDFAANGLIYSNPEGDVFFDNFYSGFQDVTLLGGSPAGFGFDTMLHEIGHALGLKHPDDDGGNARPTFAQLGISDIDVARWTVMSNNSNPGATLQMGNDITPMPLDILAIQQIYGANMSYHAGNDDYQLGPYAAPVTSKGEIYKTLWDAGGIDTIHVSGLPGGGGLFGNGTGIGATIDLRPGIGFVKGETAFPGQPQFSASGPVFGFFSMTYTAIAYNVIIENAVGTDFDDTIVGNDFGNQLDGSTGADRLWGGLGNDTLIGGTGADIANFGNAFRKYLVTGNPGASATLSGPEGIDTLNGIEALQFVDGVRSYDAGAHIWQIQRLYGSAFDRLADALGLNYHSGRLDAGTALSAVAQDLANSGEFSVAYGNLNNSGFVSQLYLNVLHRAADAGGLSYWLGQLNSGAMTRGLVLGAFSESAENISSHAAQVATGQWDIDESAASVARLYMGAFDRAPDTDGLSYWTNQLKTGLQTLLQEAGFFVTSPEFQATYGSLNNSQFATQLYLNVLDRTPAQFEVGYWADVLSGGKTRAEVTMGFTESVENQVKTVGEIDNGIVVL